MHRVVVKLVLGLVIEQQKENRVDVYLQLLEQANDSKTFMQNYNTITRQLNEVSIIRKRLVTREVMTNTVLPTVRHCPLRCRVLQNVRLYYERTSYKSSHSLSPCTGTLLFLFLEIQCQLNWQSRPNKEIILIRIHHHYWYKFLYFTILRLTGFPELNKWASEQLQNSYIPTMLFMKDILIIINHLLLFEYNINFCFPYGRILDAIFNFSILN